MNLKTTYLGIPLKNPVLVGSSPLSENIDSIREAEDAGAAAVVMHSLFEEQLVEEQMATFRHLEEGANSNPEASSYFPELPGLKMGPDEYLSQIQKLDQAVEIPVIASLNGIHRGGWVDFAKKIESAGAQALELNLYSLATDLSVDGVSIEKESLEIVREVKKNITIPVAVKLSPFYTSLAHFAKSLETAGAAGLVLFNRFYQPDLDLEELEVRPTLHFSDPKELLLRLRWLAILSGRIKCSLSASGGVRGGREVIKAVMCGAHTVQTVAAILQNGPRHIARILEEVTEWMSRHEYASVEEMRGCMSLTKCPDPGALERSNYLKVLKSWKE